MINRARKCANLNHGRLNAPVRHCPLCGEVVNEAITQAVCHEDEHAFKRRNRSTYCVDCGRQLVMRTS
jgi:hypothetical protein